MSRDTAVWADQSLDANIATLTQDRPIAHLSLSSLDELIGGIRRGRSYVISGEPGSGKTTLLDQIKTDLASQGVTVFVVSFEMGESDLAAKSLSRLSGGALPVSDIERCGEDPGLKAALDEATSAYRKIAGNIAYIDGRPSVVDISIEAGRILGERSGQPLALLVDYLQLIPPTRRGAGSDERAQIAEAIAGLRKIAKKYRAPIIAVSSINRVNYEKPSVGLSALAGSAGIEYSADVIVHLAVEGNRDERSENLGKEIRPVTATVIKQRFGKLGRVSLNFDTRFSLFSEREA